MKLNNFEKGISGVSTGDLSSEDSTICLLTHCAPCVMNEYSNIRITKQPACCRSMPI